MRQLMLEVTNLDTTEEQEDALVDALWTVVAEIHPDADIAATCGPDAEAGE